MSEKAKRKSDIPVHNWKWFGSAAHFICGRWCRFHLATQVGRYLISTVGEFVHPRHGGSERAEAEWLEKNWPGEDIGFQRKYETMVFHAGKPCQAKGCQCGIPSISGSEVDSAGYNSAKDAGAGHLRMCLKWARKH